MQEAPVVSWRWVKWLYWLKCPLNQHLVTWQWHAAQPTVTVFRCRIISPPHFRAKHTHEKWVDTWLKWMRQGFCQVWKSKGFFFKEGQSTHSLSVKWRFGVGVESDSFFMSRFKPSAITAGTDFKFPLMAYFNDPIYTCLLSYCIALSNGWPPMKWLALHFQWHGKCFTAHEC